MIYLIMAIMVLYIVFNKKVGRFMYTHDLEMVVGIFVFVIGFALIIGGMNYLFSISDVAELEAFNNEVLSAYESTIDKSERIVIYAIKDAEKEFSSAINTGNLAYFELAKSVNENIQDLRNRIREYNESLYSLRLYNSNWFMDSFVYNVPEYLKPIKMK